MKIWQIQELVETYGKDSTISNILSLYRKDKIFTCPKCQGKGRIRVISGYMDVNKLNTKYIMCKYCNGEGYVNYNKFNLKK